MKKTHIIAFMNAYSHGKSGGDMVFIEIAKRLKNVNMTIITSLLGKTLCTKHNVKGQFIITTHESTFQNVIWIYIKRTIKALFINISVEKNNVLLGTSDFLPDVLPIFLLKSKNKNARWIQHVFHVISSSRRIPHFAQKISLFLIQQRADLIVVDNKLLKDELVKTGLNSKKIYVNYPGINFDYLQSVKKTGDKSFDGVYIAQIRPAKGVLDLIDIWGVVCKKIPQAKLGIIGKGSREIMTEVKAKIARAHLGDNIKLLGFLEDDMAFSLIKTSKVFVFPSYEEGFGIAGLEAQALGLPVVAWNLPVYKEVFPKGIICVQLRNKEKFAQEIVKLLSNENMYAIVSAEALKNAARYHWESTAKREGMLIKELL